MEDGQRVGVDDTLRLIVRSGHDVANAAQRRAQDAHLGLVVHVEELDEARHDARLDHRVDLLVGTVGDVGEGPARVGEHLFVVGVEELREGGQYLLQDAHRRRRILVAAQVGQGPRDVAQEGVGRVGVDEREERLDDAALDDQVAELGAVAGDVAQRPHGLLAHVRVGRREELHEGGHGARLDHVTRLGRRARGDVGERPGGLELQQRLVVVAQVGDEVLDQVGLDHVVDGRIALARQHLAYGLHGGEELVGVLGLLDEGDDLVEAERARRRRLRRRRTLTVGLVGQERRVVGGR